MTLVFYQKPLVGVKRAPRVTVAAKVEGNVMTLSTARCSKKDQFVKKTGRQLALERLENNQVISTMNIPENTKIGAFFISNATFLATLLTEEPKKNKTKKKKC